MAVTRTTNYSFGKPTVGGSRSVWGTELNATLDQIDAEILKASQAQWVPGDVRRSGASASAGWLVCDGRLVAKLTYPKLFAAIAQRFADSTDDQSGQFFRLPNLPQTPLNQLIKT